MNRTDTAIRNLLAGLPAPGYDIGVLLDAGMYRVQAASPSRILRMLSFLKHRNAHGAHIYIRPTGESPYTLLDDLTATSLNRLSVEGYSPAAVVETSPGSFQAWLRHKQPLSKEVGTLAAKTLAEQFGADRSAADWRRFGRAPGFTNRKPKHRSAQGLYPFARLHAATGDAFREAETFRARLLTLQQNVETERAAFRLRFSAQPNSSRFATPVTLSRFRSSLHYQNRPAAADMAFCIAAVSQGWAESDIAAALGRDYLSRDTSKLRQAAYIRRTVSKAIRWVA